MFQAILEGGANFIVAMQYYQAPWLDSFFGTLAWLGGTGYLYLIPLVIWSIDYRQGVRILVLITLTLYLNSLIKDIVALPRPYLVDPRIVSAGEHGYSFPSGHAQLVMVYWGMLAAWAARRWFWCVAAFFIVFTGLSRPYLGVHYPSDVIVGWALGALTLWIYWRWWPLLEQRLEGSASRAWWAALAAGLALLLVINIALGLGATFYASIGMLLGAAMGWRLGAGAASVPAGFSADGSLWKRALRFVLGMALTLPLLSGITQVLKLMPDHTSLLAFIALLVLGLWVVWVMPQLFRMLRLTGSSGSLSGTG